MTFFFALSGKSHLNLVVLQVLFANKDMNIPERIQNIQNGLPANVRLLAVSKFQPIEKIQEAYRVGQRDFGESRAQELKEKHAALPQDIRWHFIGHLQRNKIKYIAAFVHLIQSVDSAVLLSEIDKEARKNGRIIDCLLQLHVAQESTKFGFSPQECMNYLAGGEWKNLHNIRLCGLMAMASLTNNQEQIRSEFSLVKDCFDQAKALYFAQDDAFSHLSMGMSDDYPIALACGSTMIRIGTFIFGARNY